MRESMFKKVTVEVGSQNQIMNFGGGSGGSSMAASMAMMSQLEQEMELMTEVFNRLMESCFQKCVPPKYHDGELNKGESVCVDRCVFKYMDVFQKVNWFRYSRTQMFIMKLMQKIALKLQKEQQQQQQQQQHSQQ